jgi:hypothetical protein
MSNEKKDSRLALTRRDLIKWSAFVGAALGLPRWKVFEVLEATAGKAVAAEAACATTNRSVHIVAGTGGFAWFQLLWPHYDVAAAKNSSFAYHAIGEGGLANGTDKPLYLGPEAPWKTLLANRQVSAFMGGTNETHTDQPTSSSSLGNNTGLFAACAALQSANPTLVPVIAISNGPFGAANGAPRPARVGDADGVVELFNSAASRAGGALADPASAALYEASYKGFLALHAAAGRPTTIKAFTTGKVAANLLGKNLADQLRPTDADLARYGVNSGSETKLLDIAKNLIVTAKAFKMGLTSSVVMRILSDDPHGAFNDMQRLRASALAIGTSLDAFLTDLNAVDDPTCPGSKIGENVVVSIHGDTPKNPLDRGGWPDGTPNNSNWIYVLGAGYLRTGWHGGVKRNGDAFAFNPQTGADDPNSSSAQTAMPAAAAVTYAVAKGDMRRVQDFYRGVDFSGIVVPQQL